MFRDTSSRTRDLLRVLRVDARGTTDAGLPLREKERAANWRIRRWAGLGPTMPCSNGIRLKTVHRYCPGRTVLDPFAGADHIFAAAASGRREPGSK